MICRMSYGILIGHTIRIPYGVRRKTLRTTYVESVGYRLLTNIRTHKDEEKA